MISKLTDILKDAKSGDRVALLAREYDRRYGGAARGGLDERKTDYQNFMNTYYDLVTDFWEYGWGQSFHFAPRVKGESFVDSIARHEHHIALRLGLRSGMTAVDLGCGIGGPLIEIARFSGARIIGVNNHVPQLERAAKRTEAAGLSHLVDYLKCDFMQVDAPDVSFNAAYAIEGTCCAPDKARRLWRGVPSSQARGLFRGLRILPNRPVRRQQPRSPEAEGRYGVWRRLARYRQTA